MPPSINHQYATVNGRRILSALARRYKQEVGRRVLVALARSPHREELLNRLNRAYLSLSIRFLLAAPLRRDLDGGIKITQDALCEALGLNDNRVFEIHVYKIVGETGVGIEVSLGPAKIDAPITLKSARKQSITPERVRPSDRTSQGRA
jgi:crossover junction endodeoxyribonuclease RusA